MVEYFGVFRRAVDGDVMIASMLSEIPAGGLCKTLSRGSRRDDNNYYVARVVFDEGTRELVISNPYTRKEIFRRVEERVDYGTILDS